MTFSSNAQQPTMEQKSIWGLTWVLGAGHVGSCEGHAVYILVFLIVALSRVKSQMKPGERIEL